MTVWASMMTAHSICNLNMNSGAVPATISSQRKRLPCKPWPLSRKDLPPPEEMPTALPKQRAFV